MLRPVKVICVSILLFAAGLSHAAPYQVQPGVSGTVTSVGSDTMSNLMALWASEFNDIYPHVKFQLQASGSSTAPPALTEGTANIGPMSRTLKSSEIDYFVRKHGYRPTVIRVAMDAIAIFADVDNPITSLSLKEVDAIFSATNFCGHAANIDNWQQVPQGTGLGPTAINLYGRNAVSGTYGLFKQLALCNGDFKPSIKELPSSASVIHSVAFSEEALGYAAYGFYSAGVKTVAIGDSKAVFPNEDTIASGEYPFSRHLFLMINKEPDKELPKLIKEFITFILSDSGQRLTTREGYIPISSDIRRTQLRLVGEAN